MADVALGRNADITLSFKDANGTPITSGITGLTFSLFGPASSTALVTGLTGAYFGGAEWGVSVAGATYLTTAGTYTLTVTAAGGTAPSDSVGRSRTFTVGIDQPGVRTLREILSDLTLALGDGIESATTATGTTTTFTDSYWAVGQSNELAGAEVYFLDVTDPVNTSANPVQVTASTNAGVVTFTPPRGANVPSGTPYLIGGRRYPMRQRLAAIRQVLEDLGPQELVGDRVTLTSALNTYEYAVPATFRELRRVSWQPQNTTMPTLWQPLARGIFWDYDRDRRLLVLTPAVPVALVRFRLEGLVEAAIPAKLTDVVQVRAATVVRLAELYLKSRGGDPGDKQEAAFQYQDLVRRGKLSARAGRPV